MDTDLRIPVTGEQAQLIREAARQEPEGMTAWARASSFKPHVSKSPKGTDPSVRRRRSVQCPGEQWRRETGMHSSVTKKVQHPAYRKIIDMGEKALPWILRELRTARLLVRGAPDYRSADAGSGERTDGPAAGAGGLAELGQRERFD